MLLNGNTIVKKNKNKLIKRFKSLKFTPKLAIIVLNDIENQKDYLAFKTKFASDLNVEIQIHDWSNFTTQECLKNLNILNNDNTVYGIIPQLPANSNIDINILLENIVLSKDVDGLNPKQYKKRQQFLGASNVIIAQLIKKYNFLKTKKILLIGRNKYFSQPLYFFLKKRRYHINMIRYNEYETWMAKSFDIIISTVNKPLFINASNMKKRALAIDLTYYKEDNNSKPVGAFYGNYNHLKIFTPVPGGLGPFTVYNLFANLWKLIKKHKNRK